MTSKTLLKARTIYKSGGVDRVAPTTYHVTSTSGETYVVELTLDRCTCPDHKRAKALGEVCKHAVAATIVRAKRAAAKRHAVAL